MFSSSDNHVVNSWSVIIVLIVIVLCSGLARHLNFSVFLQNILKSLLSSFASYRYALTHSTDTREMMEDKKIAWVLGRRVEKLPKIYDEKCRMISTLCYSFQLYYSQLTIFRNLMLCRWPTLLMTHLKPHPLPTHIPFTPDWPHVSCYKHSYCGKSNPSDHHQNRLKTKFNTKGNISKILDF